MVGGERANDKELKEKRLRKKRAVERRLQALAQVLAKVEDEDKSGLMLGVYDDIQEEMKTTIRKHKMKVGALLYFSWLSVLFSNQCNEFN